jgi:hypothetical protein
MMIDLQELEFSDEDLWPPAIALARAGRPGELAHLVAGLEIPKAYRRAVGAILRNPPPAKKPRSDRKFSDVQVLSIRRMVESLTGRNARQRMTYDQIADGLDISVGTLEDIVKGKHSYKDIEIPGSYAYRNSRNKTRK